MESGDFDFASVQREYVSFCPLLSICPSLLSVLVTAGVVVGGYVLVKEFLQLPLQGLECGPILFVLLPAVHHNVIHNFGADGGAWHPVALGNLLDHLVVRHGWKNQRRTLKRILTGDIILH